MAALDKAGMGPTAPAAIGDFFPGESAQQISKKSNICAGAKPFRHYHFFDAAGNFGSLDQNLHQVDNGHYTILNGDTVQINEGTLHFAISGANTLRLEPVITSAERHQALVAPLQFSTPVWMVAVAYPGTTWKRVPCDNWC